MNHRKKRVITAKISSTQKKSVIMRNMLTNLVRDWVMETTTRKSAILKSFADSFFSRLMRIASRWEKDWRREAIRYIKSVINTNNEWKKVVNELLPKFLAENKTNFVSNLKKWPRKWDWAEVVIVRLQ